jgi:hypothetical protein
MDDRISVVARISASQSVACKSFTIVIYDHNDNGLNYKTIIVANLAMIEANLALARSINYDCKVCCKLKRTFTIVSYYPKPFIVQVTNITQKKCFILILEKRKKLMSMFNQTKNVSAMFWRGKLFYRMF